jgi:hypothetical protein
MVLAAMVAILIFNSAGTIACDGVFEEFRAAASGELKAGVNSILDGVVTGVFAVFEPDDSGTSTDGGGS